MAAKKETCKKPDEELLDRYKEKLALLEQQSKEAFEKHDWSARNDANARIFIIKNQIIDIENRLHSGTKKDFINAECV